MNNYEQEKEHENKKGLKLNMKRSFYEVIEEYKNFDLTAFQQKVSLNEVYDILNKNTTCTVKDFAALISPIASEGLERIAEKAQELTVRHFGKAILLYAPIYISNYCENHCLYCGFNKNNKIKRRKLTFEEIEIEARKISETGVKHILMLTGSSRVVSSPEYIKSAVIILKKYFPSVSIEVYSMTQDEYKTLVDVGVDGVCLYQETYDEKLYAELHPAGPKRDYCFRLDCLERACVAGVRTVNLGALFGLKDWHEEMFLAGLHAKYLQDKYPDVEVSLSIPRLRPEKGGFTSAYVVNDISFVQMLLAFRIFIPRCGITISTREPAYIRDNILPLGVTKMSAGSKTEVGGYSHDDAGDGQFEISDSRSVEEIEQMIYSKGFQPIYKDWHCLV